MKSLPFKLEMRAVEWYWPVGLLLCGTVLYSIQFVGTYFDYRHQAMAGWVDLAVLYLLYRTGLAARQPWRILFILLDVFLVVRYILWRTFETLIYTGFLDFLGMVVLYVAEMYAMSLLLMGMFVNCWPLVRTPLVLQDTPDDLPHVDIFIPTYNESDDIVEVTAIAAMQIDYPKEKLHVYILDDGGTVAKRSHRERGMEAWERHFRLRRMAERLGTGYVTRETNRMAKAGNINHALNHTHSELIVVLDCDHVPTQDFLRRTVGYFLRDPKLFLVQTPHFFINHCPMEKNLEGVDNPSGENDLFYRSTHPALDAWNASYFCGSAAVLRRSCLEDVGGICGRTITEDAETAFTLHGRGYNSVFVDRPMVCGLSPETFEQYVIQRTRWAQGSVQLVLLDNPLFAKGLTFAQRIAYFNFCFFWLFGFARFTYFVMPPIFLIFGVNVYNASWLQILSYAAPFVLSNFLVMNCFYKGTRQPFFSEIYESVQAMFLIPAVLSVLRNPRKPTFKVTPKGLSSDRNYLSPMSAPFFLVILINLTAIGVSVRNWFEQPLMHDVILITGVWCCYNLYLSLVSLGAFWERRQIRRFHRINTSGPIEVFFPRMGATVKGNMLDVSLSGVGFAIPPDFPVKDEERVTLHVRDSFGKKYSFESRIKRAFKRGDRVVCGSEFIEGLASFADIVSFVFGDSERWVENWQQKSRPRGSSRMLWVFLKMGIRGVLGYGFDMARRALVFLWKLAVKWFGTSYLRDTFFAAAYWSVYHLYLGFVWVMETVERRRGRKFLRMSASGTAIVEFPLRNARVIGSVSDVSLTGVGVMLDPPFKLREMEPVVLNVDDRMGQTHRFECIIRRAMQRDGRWLCGTEFHIDMQSFPEIIRFVYGKSLTDLLFHSVWEPKHEH
jgi:cellulose synthase (UDP-forming)